ncbi:MAG: acylglycerol kinase family protein, partial [Lachnospira sp.]|nr:acylglycerol kinase family protein [Lachnospira sp.]
MKKLLLVFNPNSGKGLIKNSLMQIIQILSEADYEVTVYPTKKANDGYEKVLEVGDNYDVIVCSGGDGTLNEVVGA